MQIKINGGKHWRLWEDIPNFTSLQHIDYCLIWMMVAGNVPEMPILLIVIPWINRAQLLEKPPKKI